MVKPKRVHKQNENKIDDGLKGKIYLSRSGGERTRPGGERTRPGGERTLWRAPYFDQLAQFRPLVWRAHHKTSLVWQWARAITHESSSIKGFAVIGPLVDCWHLFLLRQCWHRQNFAFGMLLKVRWRRRRRFDKGVELSIADLPPKKFVSFSPKDEVVRLRSTQQPSALTARRLLECYQPCTDRKCHVALKQRKALNVAVKPTRI